MITLTLFYVCVFALEGAVVHCSCIACVTAECNVSAVQHRTRPLATSTPKRCLATVIKQR